MRTPTAWQWAALAIYLGSHLVGLILAVNGARWGLQAASLPLVVLAVAVSGTLAALVIVVVGAAVSRKP